MILINMCYFLTPGIVVIAITIDILSAVTIITKNILVISESAKNVRLVLKLKTMLIWLLMNTILKN